MTGAGPRVAVAVPTFNRVERLRACVASLAAQDYDDFVVRIVDNASTDGTEAFCRDLAARDPRFRYHRNAMNVGSIPNFEIARRMTTEPYFMWLGDDDAIDPGYIATCVQRLEAVPDLALVAGRVLYRRPDGICFEGIPLVGAAASPEQRFLDLLDTLVDAGAFYGVFRRAAIDDIPLINSWGTDYLFLCETAWRGGVETQPAIRCFRNDNSGHSRIREMIRGANMPIQQAENPYGAIAALFFWRILSGAPYRQTNSARRLAFAARCVEIVHRRWTVLDRPAPIALSAAIFPDLDVATEVRALRRDLARQALATAGPMVAVSEIATTGRLVAAIAKLSLSDVPMGEGEAALRDALTTAMGLPGTAAATLRSEANSAIVRHALALFPGRSAVV